MSLTSEFLSDTPAFLQKYVVLVPESLDNDVRRPGIRSFKLEAASRNAVRLALGLLSEESFPAYYLPWKQSVATSTDLGRDADYFFTSQMTNCRFSILDVADPKKPKVAHVAGNSGNSAARDKMEIDAGFIAKPAFATARRFSISQSQAKPERAKFGGGRIAAVDKVHDYAGTSVKAELQSSAFVYGVRDDTRGWSFFAQIVKGDMSQAIVDDVAILNHAHRL